MMGVAKLTAFVGFAVLCFGLLFTVYVNSATLCAGLLCRTGQSCSPGCGIDYDPLILPSIVGGALIVIGTWIFFVERPHGSKSTLSTILPGSTPHVNAVQYRGTCSRPRIALGSSDPTRSLSQLRYPFCRLSLSRVA